MYKRATCGYRFSLRMLLVAVLLFGCLLVPLLARMQKARRQLQSAQVFRQMGGEVRHKLLFESNGDVRRTSTVIYVSLGGTNALDTDLACLEDLEDLEHLSLWNTRITDAGLKHLMSLQRLRELVLSRTQVTDAGIKDLKLVESLWLNDTQISDVGLRHLARQNTLTVLDVSGTQVSDVGLEHLSRLPRLEVLDLGNTKSPTQD